MTLVTPLGKLANIHPLRLSIKDRESARAAANEFYTQLQTRGFDHLEIFQSPRPSTACTTPIPNNDCTW
jgi:hypothetical protein